MRNNLQFTGRKAVGIASLVCATSFIAAVSMLNMQTFAVSYNDTMVMIKTMPSASESQVLELADIDESKVLVTDSQESGNRTDMTVFDTFSVNIAVDGTVQNVVATPMKLNEILVDAEIQLSEKDIISHDLEQMIDTQTDISITRVTHQTIQETQYLEYRTIKRATSDLEFGETKVMHEGQQGEKLVTSEIVLHDGVLVSKEVIGEEILKQPINNVIEYGSFNVNRGVTHRDGVITTASGEKLTYSKVIDVEATAYSTEGWNSKHTKSGTVARVGAIAVDPRVIPLGVQVYITCDDGKSWVYGKAVAEDTGGAIKGNKIDLFFNTQRECINFGRQQAKVYVLS